MGHPYLDFCNEISELWTESLTTTVPAHANLDVKDVTAKEVRNAVEACTLTLSPEVIRMMSGEFVRVLIIGQRMGVNCEETIRSHLEAFIDTDAFERLQNIYKGIDERNLH